MSDTLTFYDPVTAVSFPAETVRVRNAKGEELPLLRCNSVRRTSGSEPSVAEFELITDDYLAADYRYRLEDLRGAVAAETEVHVVVEAAWGAAEIFCGHITNPSADVAPNFENVNYLALDFRHRLNGIPVTGQKTVNADGTVVQIPGLACHFNPGGHGNIRDDQSLFDTEGPLFADPDGPDTTRKWYLSEIAYYLIYQYGTSWIDNVHWDQSPTELDFYVDDLNLEGKPLNEALAVALQSFGWNYYLAPSLVPGSINAEIHFFAQGATKSTKTRRTSKKYVLLQAAGENLDLGKSNVNRVRLNEDYSSIVTVWEAVGGRKTFEDTFVLVPGWDPSLEGAAPDKYKRLKNDDWDTYKDVYRKFVLHEANDMPSAWSRAAYNLDTIFGTDDWIRRRRRFFLKALTFEDANRTIRKPALVEIDEAGGTAFTPARGDLQIKLLKEECGIYIDGDALGRTGATIWAIRITAAVESDERIRVTQDKSQYTPTAYTITRMLNLENKFGYEVARSTSQYVSGGSDVTVRDDTTDMQKFVDEKQAFSEDIALSGSLVIPFYDDLYSIGDRILGIKGRGLSFQLNVGPYPRYPMINMITWRFGSEFVTEISLTDDRMAEI